MPLFCRFSGFSLRLALITAATVVTASFAATSSAQTAPQLLPYTAKLVAGGATTNPAKGTACPSSGYIAIDGSGDGCLATEILLGTGATTPGPRDAAGDSAGNVFFTDYVNATVRRVDALTGIVTVVAGGGTAAAGTSSGALGSTVKLSHPAGIIFAPNGDLYFSDPGNGQVFKIASTGGLIGGSVGSVAITSGGTGYTVPPAVTFSAPPTGGTTATGTAVLTGGVVTSVTIVNAGSGYTSAPTVTFATSTAGTTATGVVGMTGVISLVAGNSGGTYGYAASNTTATVTAANSYLRAPYGISLDTKGDLFIVDEYTEAVVVLNTNTTGSNTVNNVVVPAGQILKIAGTSTNATYAPYCINGSSGTYGCSYGLYTTGVQANTTTFDSTYSVAVDPSGNVYGGDEYYNSVFKVAPTGILTTYAGIQNSAAKVLQRSKAGTFGMGSIFGLTADTLGNLYIGDASSGVIWRVDGATQSMYPVAGGVGDTGSATYTAPTAICSSAAGATDSYGDGCPATQATIGKSGTGSYATTTLPGPGIYGVTVDAYADLFFGDTENNNVREISSGTQFGPVGANQPTQIVDIHFAASDLPASSGAYTLTSGATNFSLGTATCTTNAADGTTDCLLPVTATPTTLGHFTGTLQVTSVAGGVSSFQLSGTYIQSPVTRTALTHTAAATCTGTTTYSTTTPVTLTAKILANGPNPPVGSADTITFYQTIGGVTTAIGSPVAVSNLGTTSAPVYGAVLTQPFPTVGTYTFTATYSGDTYYKPSTGKDATTLTTSLPGFTIAPVAYMESSVVPGQTALYSFTVSENVYTGSIGFTVTGLPANSTYSISPSAALIGAGCSVTNTVALSILTQQQTTVQPGGFGGTGHGPWSLLSMFIGLGLALMVGLRRRSLSQRFSQLAMASALLLIATGTVACGKGVGTVIQPATPAGTYTITVTPTASVGAAPSSITFPLIVQ